MIIFIFDLNKQNVVKNCCQMKIKYKVNKANPRDQHESDGKSAFENLEISNCVDSY